MPLEKGSKESPGPRAQNTSTLNVDPREGTIGQVALRQGELAVHIIVYASGMHWDLELLTFSHITSSLQAAEMFASYNRLDFRDS